MSGANLVAAGLIFACWPSAWAQNAAPAAAPVGEAALPVSGAARPVSGAALPVSGPVLPVSEATLPASYVLGPDDQINIRALDADEISDKPIRIGLDGRINLPLVGRMMAAGLTTQQLEAELESRLKAFVKTPHVAVAVLEMRSQPVSVIGAVSAPGVHQLQGRKTLVEMLSMAGGLKPEAGYSVKISRRIERGPIPLPGAAQDSSGQYWVAEVPLRDITDATNPAANIAILPEDVITVPIADMVYVIGDVNKPGNIVLGGANKVSVLQALAAAGGFGRTAKPKECRIMRVVAGSTTRQEVKIDLKAALEGKANDLAMQPSDILFVPSSIKKDVALRTLEAMVASGPAAILYRVP
jgi:polysaccharide biosynthesis/export protein